MSESVNETTLTGPGQGVINDAYGVQWQINDAGLVQAGDAVDDDPTPVVQIAFINGMLWRQHATDLRWSCKHHPHEKWGPSTSVSPLPGPASTDSVLASEFSHGTGTVIEAIAALRSDFDAWKSSQPPSPTPTQIMQALTAFRADLDSREDALSGQISALSAGSASVASGLIDLTNAIQGNQTTLIALLDQVIAGQINISNAFTVANTVAAANQQALVLQLNAIQAANTTNQAALIASLSQIVDAVTGPQAGAAGIAALQAAVAILQKDFTALTHTLDSIALGISEKLQEILLLDDPAANAEMQTAIKAIETDTSEILTDAEKILALITAEAAPAQIVLDLEDFTTVQQAIPSRQGP